MYTRCPSCRAEICFEPPANAANLPDGYKHRIKCPSCGVTIGVKLPNRDAIASVQPTFTPANPNAFPSETIYNAPNYEPSAEETKAAKKEARKAAAGNKKTGRSRNAVVFVFAALFIVISLLGFFFVQGDIAVNELGGFGFFDGVGNLKNIAENPDFYGEMLKADPANGIANILPSIFFLLAILIAFVALVAFIGKKYSRFFNFLFAAAMLAVSVCIIFFNPMAVIVNEAGGTIADYFAEIIENGLYLIVVPAALSAIYFICSLIFLKSMKRKVA